MNDRQEALNKLLKGLKSVQRKKEESEETNMDDSNIKPEEVKTASEGAGKLMASIGKELDEHDTIGKVGNATADSIKSSSFLKRAIGITLICVLAIPAIIAILAALAAIFLNVFARV